jgi:hypothetical protein
MDSIHGVQFKYLRLRVRNVHTVPTSVLKINYSVCVCVFRSCTVRKPGVMTYISAVQSNGYKVAIICHLFYN